MNKENIHNSENSYFVRILKYKVSQEKEKNTFFIICVSLYAFCCMYSEYSLHILENKSIINIIVVNSNIKHTIQC